MSRWNTKRVKSIIYIGGEFMKKRLYVLLAICCMTFLTFTGCTTGKDGTTNTPTSTPKITTAPVATTAPIATTAPTTDGTGTTGTGTGTTGTGTTGTTVTPTKKP